MAEALRKELNPGEDVRWCGQPDPGILFRRQILVSALGTVLILALSCALGYSGYSTLRQLRELGMPPHPTQSSPSYESVHIAFGLAGLISLLLVPAAAGPWLMASTARRTAYAVTRTRVLKIVLSRRGQPSVNSVEPAHPLHMRRQGLESEHGDIHLYPGAGRNGGTILSLEAVNDARTVERLIRQCFDP